MKTLLMIVIFIFSSSIVYFFILGINSKSKDAPGLIAGYLSKCPDTPNCICSEIKDHSGHYISPITINKLDLTSSDPLLRLKEIVSDMGGTIQIEKENYFAATFTSLFFRFVDDLEVRLDNDKKTIHIRSASRVGRSDLGINKKRLKLLKKNYNMKISTEKKDLT